MRRHIATAVILVLASHFPTVSLSMIGGTIRRTSLVLAVPALRARRPSTTGGGLA